MTRLLILIIALLGSLTMMAQTGFVYIEQEPERLSAGSKFSLECQNGFIVTNNTVTPSQQISIIKFTTEGEVVHRFTHDNLCVANLFLDPEQPNYFYAICDDLERKAVEIIHFDGNLNILDSIDVVIPYDLSNYIQAVSRALLTADKKIVYTSALLLNEYPFSFENLHLKFDLEGQIEAHRLETNSTLHPALFLLPNSNVYSYDNNTLSVYDEELDLDMIHQYSNLDSDETMFIAITSEDPTVVSLPDTSFVIADEVQLISIEDYHHNENMAFFKSNLSGEIVSYIMVGGENVLERPALVHSIDYIDPSAIYLCAFEHLTPDSWGMQVPYNNIFLKKVNQEMEVIWEKTYCLGEYHYEPHYVLATQDGGCLVTGTVVYEEDSKQGLFVLKVNSDGLAGTAENIVKDFCSYTLYPNPTNGLVTITGKDLKHAEVFNTLGQQVATASGEGETLHIDIANLPAGVYFVNVTDGEGRKCVKKVVKE